MKRRAPSPTGLPAALRVYRPDRWLLPDEEPTDALAVHYFAWLLRLTACANTLRVPLGELTAECWDTSGANPGRCACRRCNVSSSAPNRDAVPGPAADPLESPGQAARG